MCSELISSEFVNAVAIGDNRFSPPIAPTDVFTPIECFQRDVEFSLMVREATDLAISSASRHNKKHLPKGGKVLSLLLSSRYRRGVVSNIAMIKEKLVRQINTLCEKTEPIELLLSFFPCKVRQPLKTFFRNGGEIDLCEIASLLRLYEMCLRSTAISGQTCISPVSCMPKAIWNWLKPCVPVACQHMLCRSSETRAVITRFRTMKYPGRWQLFWHPTTCKATRAVMGC